MKKSILFLIVVAILCVVFYKKDIKLGGDTLVPERVSAVPAGQTWVASWMTLGFDTPTGDLTEGFWADAGYTGVRDDNGLFFPSDKGEAVCYQGNDPAQNKQFLTVFCSETSGTEAKISGEVAHNIFNNNGIVYRSKAEKTDYEELRTINKPPQKTIYK